MRAWWLILSLTLLAGCTHDLAALRASTPEVMQEVAAPYNDLSKCAKHQVDNTNPIDLSLAEDPHAGVNRLTMLRARGGFLSRQRQDAVFEFTFIRQSSRSTLIEFRNAGSTAHSDITWNAIGDCSRHIMSELARSAGQSDTQTESPSHDLQKLIEK